MDKLKKYLVKGVVSGDNIKLSGSVKKNSDDLPEEINFKFSLISAPKASSGNGLQEAPFGHEAREYLRDLLLGKVVQIKSDYTVNDCIYGQVFLDKLNVAYDLVSKGYVRVGFISTQSQNLDKSDYYEKLKKLEGTAIKDKVGVHGDLSNCWFKGKFADELAPGEMEALVGRKNMKGLIAYVVNPAIYSVFLYELNTFIKVSLEYLALPAKKELTAYNARRACAERLCLSKDVTVTIKSLSGETFSCLITCDGEDLACNVLKNGLTYFHLPSNTMINMDEVDKVKAAQKAAQIEGIRYWKGQTQVKKDSGKKLENLETQVISVNSGDSLNVYKKGELTRIFLSHIKAPALANAKTKELNERWAHQSKEYLRQTLVGQIVRLEFDFVKEFEVNGEKRNMIFCSVIKEVKGHEVNINEEIIRKGLATFVSPGRNDDHLSKHLPLYSEVDLEAKKNKVGIYSTKDPGDPDYSDLQYANKEKINNFKEFLDGQRNLDCLVDYCVSGARFKVRVERNKCIVPFNLIGLKTCVKDPNNTKQLNEFHDKAMQFVNTHFMQREGKVDLIQSDRAGNYFGYLRINDIDVSSELLKEGLAVINLANSSQIDNLKEYEKQEKLAKEKGKGVWAEQSVMSVLKEGYVVVSNEIKMVDKDVKLVVTDYASINDFSLNIMPNPYLAKIDKLLENESKTMKTLEQPIRKNTQCIALCSIDNEYYRAKITRVHKDNNLEVEFYDFGTIDKVASKDAYKMSQELLSIPAQGLYGEFAFMKFSKLGAKLGLEKNPDFVDLEVEKEASIVYSKAVEGREKYGLVIYRKGNNLKSSLNWEFLESGYARLIDADSLPERFSALVEAEKLAKNANRGVWAEGFGGEDDEY